tara:strand:- start:152 stop:535 length:384 start_codon:yes stop_codon:yes gene_type:complete
MGLLFLYAIGIFLAWVLLEVLTRKGLMVSENAALMFSLGVMLAVIGIVDWQINSPIVNARTGNHVSLSDYFWDNAIVVLISFFISFFFGDQEKERKIIIKYVVRGRIGDHPAENTMRGWSPISHERL